MDVHRDDGVRHPEGRSSAARNQGRASASLVRRLPDLGFAATTFAVYAWWDRHPEPSWSTQPSFAWVPMVAVLPFAARCLMSRRWHVPPALAAAALALGAVRAGGALLPPRLDPAAVAPFTEQAARRVEEVERDARDLATWRAGGAPTDAVPLVNTGFDLGMTLHLPFAIPIRYGENSKRYTVIRGSGAFKDTRHAWDADGEGVARDLPARLAAARAERDAYEAGLARPPRPLSEEALGWAMWTGELALLMGAVNALALLAPRRVRSSIESVEAPG